MRFEDLSPELQEKAKACRNPEELAALAESEGLELSDEELNSLNGGTWQGCGNNQCGVPYER